MYHTKGCGCNKLADCFIELNKSLFVNSDMNLVSNNYDNSVEQR